MLYELAVVGDLPLPSASHAAVIRSIKKNRRQSKSAAKPVAESDSKATTPPEATPRRSTSVSASSASTKLGIQPRQRHLSVAERNLYASDPVPSWMQYDLSPSVFTQPQSSLSQRTTSSDKVDASIDALSAAASSKQPVPSGFSENADWGVMPSFSSANQAGAKAPANPPAALSQQQAFSDFLRATLPTTDSSSRAAQHRQTSSVSSSSNSGSGSPSKMAASLFPSTSQISSCQAMDTISQVLDTIQLRQADWLMGQSTDAMLTAPYNDDWNSDAFAELNNALLQSPAMFAAELTSGPVQASAQQDTLDMWHSVPEGFECVHIFVFDQMHN
jgi:hypothetical protein